VARKEQGVLHWHTKGGNARAPQNKRHRNLYHPLQDLPGNPCAPSGIRRESPPHLTVSLSRRRPKEGREAIKNAVAALDRPREHILLRVVVFEGEEKLLEDSGFSFLDTQKLFTFPSLKHRERLQGQLTLRGKGGEATRRLEQELLVLEGEWGESRVGERVYYRVEEGNLGA